MSFRERKPRDSILLYPHIYVHDFLNAKMESVPKKRVAFCVFFGNK